MHLVKAESRLRAGARKLESVPKRLSKGHRSSGPVPDPGTMVHGPPAGLDGFRVRGVRDWVCKRKR